jgi:hypothetical protein
MNFFLLSLIKAAVVAFVLLTTLAYLQWVERKVIAHIQVRMGPSRVGPHGLMQPLADVIKLITKEDLIPPYVNKFLYLAAPFFAITMALLSISVIPFGGADPHLRRQHLDATDRSEHRRPVRAGGFFGERVWNRAGGVGFEQQIFADGRPAQLGADDQLRIAAEHGGGRAAAAGEHAEPAPDRDKHQAGYYLGFIPRWSISRRPCRRSSASSSS